MVTLYEKILRIDFDERIIIPNAHPESKNLLTRRKFLKEVKSSVHLHLCP
jgi:6-phosphogluconolactonase/glucosamine-6-phosphate isomerase/deaminase